MKKGLLFGILLAHIFCFAQHNNSGNWLIYLEDNTLNTHNGIVYGTYSSNLDITSVFIIEGLEYEQVKDQHHLECLESLEHHSIIIHQPIAGIKMQNHDCQRLFEVNEDVDVLPEQNSTIEDIHNNSDNLLSWIEHSGIYFNTEHYLLDKTYNHIGLEYNLSSKLIFGLGYLNEIRHTRYIGQVNLLTLNLKS